MAKKQPCLTFMRCGFFLCLRGAHGFHGFAPPSEFLKGKLCKLMSKVYISSNKSKLRVKSANISFNLFKYNLLIKNLYSTIEK